MEYESSTSYKGVMRFVVRVLQLPVLVATNLLMVEGLGTFAFVTTTILPQTVIQVGFALSFHDLSKKKLKLSILELIGTVFNMGQSDLITELIIVYYLKNLDQSGKTNISTRD